MTAIIIILSIIAFIAVLINIPVRVKIYAKYDNSEFVNDYKIKYGFITIKKKKQKSHNETETDSAPKKKTKNKPSNIIRFIKTNIKDIKRLISDVLKYTSKKLIRIEMLSLKSQIGTDDAMNTALSYGSASAVLYNSLGVFEKQVKIKHMDIDFQPDFTQEKIFIEFTSIIRTKIYNVFGLAVLALSRAWPIIKKRGEIYNGKSD